MQEYITSAEMLFKEAERAFNQYGLEAEQVALQFVNAAVNIVVNHVQSETDKQWISWVNSKETHIKKIWLDLYAEKIKRIKSR